MKTYHIYYHDEVLFKDLNNEEFNIIWGRINLSYHQKAITYTEVSENPTYQLSEHSY